VTGGCVAVSANLIRPVSGGVSEGVRLFMCRGVRSGVDVRVCGDDDLEVEVDDVGDLRRLAFFALIYCIGDIDFDIFLRNLEGLDFFRNDLLRFVDPRFLGDIDLDIFLKNLEGDFVFVFVFVLADSFFFIGDCDLDFDSLLNSFCNGDELRLADPPVFSVGLFGLAILFYLF
jgi:hypothetical protein